MMEERRRFVRFASRMDVAYTLLPAGVAQRTIARDISAGGLRLFMDRPLALGAQLQVALRLPGREQPVNAIAQIVWSEESETFGGGESQRSVEVGVRCLEISPQDQEAVTQFIEASLQSGTATDFSRAGIGDSH